jgi:hypothetical protein
MSNLKIRDRLSWIVSDLLAALVRAVSSVSILVLLALLMMGSILTWTHLPNWCSGTDVQAEGDFPRHVR